MKKNLSLLFLYFFTRIQVLLFGLIPFGFDHGKDSLAIMHMLLLKSPKLIGPWTSIPGLYFGPGWYYLLAPGFLLTDFNPMAGVAVIILLGVLQLWLVSKHFGFLAGLIVAVAPFWFTVTTSAWNPFPLTLVAWLILIILDKLSSKKKMAGKISPELLWGAIGFLMASGFHFSTAFAVLYPVLIFISIKIRKLAFSWKKAVFTLIGFALPFLPQFIFELRHGFSQTKGVLSYIRGDVNIETGAKPSILNIFTQSVGEIKLAIFPNLSFGSWDDYLKFTILGVALFLSWKWRNQVGKKILKRRLLEFVWWFAVVVIWLSFTHYNLWYFLGLMPLAVVWFVEFFKHINRKYSILLIVLLIFSSLFYFSDYTALKDKLSLDRGFLPIKKQAINLVYEKADGQPFASYQYVPDIYDFSYQYLYFWGAVKGEKLPTEFSYEPNTPVYVVQKPDLLQHFSKSVTKEEATKIFFIVEKPGVEEFLERWWDRQHYGEIIHEFKLSDEVTVFEATPPGE